MSERPLRILIMEDEPDSNKLYCIMVRDMGHEPVPCFRSEDAWERLQSEPIDLAILDIEMKRSQFDGIEVCRRIREHDRLADLPICVITGFLDHLRAQASFDAGTNAYIVKPFDLQELESKVRELIDR